MEEASHEDVSRLRRRGTGPFEGVESGGDGREGPFSARVAGGRRAAHMGEPEVEGQRRVAPHRPAARLLLPGP